MTALTAGRIGIAAQAIGHSGGVSRRVGEVREGARSRSASRSAPSKASRSRSRRWRWTSTPRGCSPIAPPRSPTPARTSRSPQQGETLRLDGRAQARGRSGADSRRLRVHDRVSRRAPLSRREDHRDLRRHLGDSAAHHRPLPAGPARIGSRCDLSSKGPRIVVREPRAAMNLMEYQGKELFKRSGIDVPRGQHALTPQARSRVSRREPRASGS